MVMINMNYLRFSATAFTGITKIWCSFSKLPSYSCSMLNATTAFMMKSIRIRPVFCKILWTIKYLFAGYTTFSVLLPRCSRLGLQLRWRFGGYSTVQQLQLIVPGMFVIHPRVRDHIQIVVRHVRRLVGNSKAVAYCHD